MGADRYGFFILFVKVEPALCAGFLHLRSPTKYTKLCGKMIGDKMTFSNAKCEFLVAKEAGEPLTG
jgi:hypothetical protein